MFLNAKIVNISLSYYIIMLVYFNIIMVRWLVNCNLLVPILLLEYMCLQSFHEEIKIISVLTNKLK